MALTVLKGANPSGGGLEMLSRLVGRSRALEIVLGADDLDADTAARYGCLSFPVLMGPGCCLVSGCAVRVTLRKILNIKRE